MAKFDGIIPELAKAGFIKKVNDLRSDVSTIQQDIVNLSESNITMFWSNSIPNDLGIANENQPFSTQVKAYSLIDVKPTYSVVSGNLPLGLSINSMNGYISGTVGNYESITPCTFTVQAYDGHTTINKQFTITVNGVNDPPTWITATELGDMTEDYISIQLSVNDPDSVPTFSIVSGSLPNGVTLSSSGLISGNNPRDNMTYTFTVEATDGDNAIQREFSFVAFNEAPVWLTGSDLGVVSGLTFSRSLSATDNDSGLLTYSVASGSELPSGVTLSSNGVLSGSNPLLNTTHTFDIDVSDGVNVVSKTFFFYSYNQAPTWVSGQSLGSFNTPTISIQLQATDPENEVLSYSVVGGSLPSGLVLSSSGLISGSNPFNGITTSFTVAVSDKANSVNREFSITCEVVAGEAIYSTVGNYSFTVPAGVTEVDALVVAGATGFTTFDNIKATKGSTTSDIVEYRANTGNVQLTASCYGDYGFVVGSSDGNLYRMEQSDKWFRKSVKVLTSGVIKIIYINNTYYAFDSNGRIASSNYGLNWGLLQNLGIGLYDAAYNSNIFVVVGSSGAIKYSTDNMVTWQSAVSVFGTSTINTVLYGNGIFVAAGAGGKVATSNNGINWTLQASGVTDGLGAASLFANGKFILSKADNAITSTDGITWVVDSSIPTAGIMSYNPYCGYIFIGQSNTVYKSSDLISWSSKRITQEALSVGLKHAISYDNNNNLLYASGYVTTRSAVFFSEDGGNTMWNLFTRLEDVISSTASPTIIAIDSDGFIRGNSVYSFNKNGHGKMVSDNYRNAITDSTSIACDYSCNTIIIGRNGGNHQISTDGGFSFSSMTYSGVNWSTKTVKFYYYKGYWLALVTSDGVYGFYVSSDLVNWTGYGASTSGNKYFRVLNDIAFIDNNGVTFYSSDGATWNAAPSGFNPTGYRDGNYYQYNNTSTIKYSVGISSTFTTVNVTSLIGNVAGLSSVTTNKYGHFVFENSTVDTNAKGMYISKDGVVSSRVSNYLSDLTNVNDRFLSNGDLFFSNGSIVGENSPYQSLLKPLKFTPYNVSTFGNTEVVCTESGYVRISIYGQPSYWLKFNGWCESIALSDRVVIFTNSGIYVHYFSTRFTDFYPFNTVYSGQPYGFCIYDNKYIVSFSGYVVSVDITTRAVTQKIITASYCYREFVIFNGELYCSFNPIVGGTGYLYKLDIGLNATSVLSVFGKLFVKDSILYVFADKINRYESTDGINFVNYTAPTQGTSIITDLVYMNGYWVVCYKNNLNVSTDLYSWTQTTFSEYNTVLYSIGVIPYQDKRQFYIYGSNGTKLLFEVVHKGTTNTDATLLRPSTEGFSLTNPNNNGNYGKLSGVAGYKNNIPVTPNSVVNVSVPSLDGAVRIIWGGGREYPDNAV